MATARNDDEEVVSINGSDPDAVRSASAGGEVELDLVDDTPEADRGRKPLGREVKDPDDNELATYSEGVKKRFSELTHARHDERRAREAAERERDEAVNAARTLLQRNQALQQRTVNGETHLVAATKAAAEAELESARKELKAAKEAFDPDAEMAAQEKMMEAKLRLREVERFRPAPVQTGEKEVQLAPVEAPSTSVDQKTLRWQARNQWFGTRGNEEMTALALAVHKRLTEDEGIDPRSDTYFEKVDGRLREVFPDFFGEAEDKPADDSRSKQRTTPRASPVASATRTAAGVTKVRLTQTQLALARKFGLTPQQYAQEVARLEQQ